MVPMLAKMASGLSMNRPTPDLSEEGSRNRSASCQFPSWEGLGVGSWSQCMRKKRKEPFWLLFPPGPARHIGSADTRFPRFPVCVPTAPARCRCQRRECIQSDRAVVHCSHHFDPLLALFHLGLEPLPNKAESPLPKEPGECLRRVEDFCRGPRWSVPGRDQRHHVRSAAESVGAPIHRG